MKFIKKCFKRLVILAFICGILYALYKHFTKEDEFEEFDDDFELDEDKPKDTSLVGKVKGKVKSIIG